MICRVEIYLDQLAKYLLCVKNPNTEALISMAKSFTSGQSNAPISINLIFSAIMYLANLIFNFSPELAVRVALPMLALRNATSEEILWCCNLTFKIKGKSHLTGNYLQDEGEQGIKNLENDALKSEILVTKSTVSSFLYEKGFKEASVKVGVSSLRCKPPDDYLFYLVKIATFLPKTEYYTLVNQISLQTLDNMTYQISKFLASELHYLDLAFQVLKQIWPITHRGKSSPNRVPESQLLYTLVT